MNTIRAQERIHSITRARIDNWSIRWKISKGKKITRRILGEIVDHPEFFNLTEIDETIVSFSGRKIVINISKVKLTLGNVDKKFHDLIKENGWTLHSSDPISWIEEQMFR